MAEFPVPKSRKFLLVSPLDHPVTVWLDEEGGCELPVCVGREHHLYVSDGGRKFAYRCPRSLSKREQEQVFYDDPPGTGRLAAKEYIEQRRAEGKARGHGKSGAARFEVE